MGNVLFYVLVGVIFLTMVSVLVAAHEYGHYLFARVFGMGIEEFSIGMGKRLVVWKRRTYLVPVDDGYVHDPKALSAGMSFEGGSIARTSTELLETPEGRMLRETTEFTVRMLPVGGFVRIKGMVPEDDGSEIHIPGGFYNKPPWQRLIVLIGGPLFSVLAGLIVLTAVYATTGIEKPDLRPIIGAVVEGSKTVREPAWDAGLRPGDAIVSVNQQPIQTFYQFVRIVNVSPNARLSVVYRRDAKLYTTVLTPALGESGVYDAALDIPTDSKVQGRIGVEFASRHVSQSLPEAFVDAVKMPELAVAGLLDMVKKPSRFKDDAGSAISMVRITADVVKEGASKTIEWAGALSIMLGIFNLLPFPPLDGGQMVMAFAEMLRGGRRLSMRVQQTLVNAGVVAVLLLFGFAVFFDIQRLTDKSGPSITSSPPTQQKSR